ncbi:hypothetical protein Tco_0377572 [Tanacetum coccineum]
MSTPSNNSQMHNDIMAASSKERPSMLAPDNYAQWKVPVEGDNPGQPRVDREETYLNTTPENEKLIDAEAEAINMILNGIGDNIYSTVDAYPNAREIFVSKQQNDLDTVSFHKLFDILKQHQNEVNEIHAERIARNANPLALVGATQHYPDDYTQSPKPYKTHAHSSRQTPLTKTYATTRNKGKEIVKPPSPQSESASKKDNDEEQAQRDKQMQKSLASIAKHFKNIYRPTKKTLELHQTPGSRMWILL